MTAIKKCALTLFQETCGNCKNDCYKCEFRAQPGGKNEEHIIYQCWPDFQWSVQAVILMILFNFVLLIGLCLA